MKVQITHDNGTVETWVAPNSRYEVVANATGIEFAASGKVWTKTEHTVSIVLHDAHSEEEEERADA